VASEGGAPRSGAAPKVWPVASGVLALWPERGPLPVWCGQWVASEG